MNFKIFLQKAVFQIGQEKCLWLKKLKNIVLWKNVISDLEREEIFGRIYAEELQKTNQINLDFKK